MRSSVLFKRGIIWSASKEWGSIISYDGSRTYWQTHWLFFTLIFVAFDGVIMSRFSYSGSGFGSVDWAVVSKSRGLLFDSSHWKKYIRNMFIVNCWQDKNKEKWGREWLFLKISCWKSAFPQTHWSVVLGYSKIVLLFCPNCPWSWSKYHCCSHLTSDQSFLPINIFINISIIDNIFIMISIIENSANFADVYLVRSFVLQKAKNDSCLRSHCIQYCNMLFFHRLIRPLCFHGKTTFSPSM